LCSEKIDDMIVAGIDLYRGSVLSREGAYYSISIVSKDKIIYEAQDLSLPKVLRLLHEYKPRYLVVDNLYELAPDRKGLVVTFSVGRKLILSINNQITMCVLM
jgi:predicted RNase H-like nuclease (RuvC/YqgF family)